MTFCSGLLTGRRTTILGMIFSIASMVSSTFTIIYFSIQLDGVKQYDYIYDYHATSCIPMSSKVVQINCDPDDTPHWLITYITSTGNTIISNPFAISTDSRFILYGTNYSCMCRNTVKGDIQVGCTYWTNCLFDSEFVVYMQRDNKRYYFTYTSFVATSVLSLLLSIFTLPITIKSLRNMKNDDEHIKLLTK